MERAGNARTAPGRACLSNQSGAGLKFRFQEVSCAALSLDVRDRAALAQRLLAILDNPEDEEAEQLWAQEAEGRLEEFRVGRAKAVPSQEGARKAEKLLPSDFGLS